MQTHDSGPSPLILRLALSATSAITASRDEKGESSTTLLPVLFVARIQERKGLEVGSSLRMRVSPPPEA